MKAKTVTLAAILQGHVQASLGHCQTILNFTTARQDGGGYYDRTVKVNSKMCKAPFTLLSASIITLWLFLQVR